MSLCSNETSSPPTVSSFFPFRSAELQSGYMTLMSPCLHTVSIFDPTDFLGRTEIRLAEIKKDQGSKGPITKRLLLHEVPTGEIVVRLDLQLFEEP